MPCAAARQISAPPGVAAFLFALACALAPHALAQPAEPFKTSVSEERVELFVAQLKRRALQALESHREVLAQPAQPAAKRKPPLYSLSADFGGGYESNVLLDGNKQGDVFFQESASVSLLPKITSWLDADLSYDLFNTHYSDLRDANLWMNTMSVKLKAKPHQRLRTEAFYEYGVINFPEDTSSSFFDHRTGLKARVGLSSWLSLGAGWSYLRRSYDTRLARDGNGDDQLESNRKDQRQTLSEELIFRTKRTYAKLAGQHYRNDSNDAFQNAYDWQDGQVQALISHVLSEHWVANGYTAIEMRNYEQNTVSSINVAEKDTLTTLVGSLIYLINDSWQATYSLTYRHQDSNNPVLDFTDWVNQWRVSYAY